MELTILIPCLQQVVTTLAEFVKLQHFLQHSAVWLCAVPWKMLFWRMQRNCFSFSLLLNIHLWFGYQYCFLFYACFSFCLWPAVYCDWHVIEWNNVDVKVCIDSSRKIVILSHLTTWIILARTQFPGYMPGVENTFHRVVGLAGWMKLEILGVELSLTLRSVFRRAISCVGCMKLETVVSS